MPSIADIYVQVMPETSRIADGIVKAFREVDPKAAEAGRRWGQEIQRGLGETTVKLEADTKQARADIDEASKNRDAKVHVDADTEKARLEIDEVARNRKANIRVDSDALVSSVSRSFSQMAPAFAGAGTQLSSSLAASGAQSATEVGGSLSTAMGPVGAALSTALIGGAVTAAAGVAAALTGALGLIPAGLGGGVAVLGTLVTGLDGVKDAWDAAGKAADSATKDGEEKSKAVAAAQRSLKDAVQDEANAQKDVANARKDARQQLEDLNVQLRGGVLDEKSAILDAQAARRDLATGRYKDAIEYQQAKLRVQQADQRVLESHERNVELQQKATEANAKGVDQNDQVVAANQRLARSHDAVAAAQRNLTDAEKPSSNQESLIQSMAKLSPVAQGFVNTLVGLKPAWQSLKFGVQDSLLAGIGPEIATLTTQYLPLLKSAMGGLAGTMNAAFKDVGAWLSNPQTMATMQQIVTNIGGAFQNWAQSIVPFSNAFLTITKVGSGFLPELGKMITDGANAFNNFITQAAKSGQLQQWMHTGIEAVTQLLKMMPILGKMFMDLAPLAIPFLQTVSKILPIVEPLFSFLGQAVAGDLQIFNTFMSLATQKISDLWGGVKKLGDIFAPVWQGISGAIDKAWKIIEPILKNFKDFLVHLDPTGILGHLVELADKLHLPGSTNVVAGTPTAAPTSPGAAAGSLPDLPTGGWFGGGGRPATRGFTTTPSTALPGAATPTVPGVAPSSMPSVTPSGDAGLLAGVPAGKYLQTQAADLTKGIGDCSSAVEDLINMMDGVSTAGRQMSTGNTSQWLAAHGFLPTTKMVPGAFNVGFNDHHMQATLPGGTNFNWGSDAAAAQRGIGGTGAFDPAFTQHFYRYPSAAGMPTIASPLGVSPDGQPLGTQQSPMYVMPAMSGGQQLGQDFLSGIGEIFGVDGSIFKNPLDSGLFKGFKGLMSAITGKGQGGGLPAAAFAGGDGGGIPAAGGGGGDIFSSLLNMGGSMLKGVTPQAFGDLKVGGPAEAPTDQVLMPFGNNTFAPSGGGNASLPGRYTPSGPSLGKSNGDQNTVNHNSTYVFNGSPPPGSNDFARNIDVTKARSTFGRGVPGMSI